MSKVGKVAGYTEEGRGHRGYEWPVRTWMGKKKEMDQWEQ
jgi:hypothetical protein